MKLKHKETHFTVTIEEASIRIRKRVEDREHLSERRQATIATTERFGLYYEIEHQWKCRLQNGLQAIKE